MLVQASIHAEAGQNSTRQQRQERARGEQGGNITHQGWWRGPGMGGRIRSRDCSAEIPKADIPLIPQKLLKSIVLVNHILRNFLLTIKMSFIKTNFITFN